MADILPKEAPGFEIGALRVPVNLGNTSPYIPH